MRLSYRKYNLAKGLVKVRTRTAVVLSAAAVVLGSGGGLSLARLGAVSAITPSWNVDGAYVLDFEYLGGHYMHDATLSGQNGAGDFAAAGGHEAGAAVYAFEWNGTGNVTGDAVTLSVDYTVGAPGTHMDMAGTIAPDGTMSGTWTDNYGGTRSGTWESATGIARQASQVVVTPLNTQGWSTADTRPGGAVSFATDATAPGDPHIGALKLTTDATTAAKAQYMHASSTMLSDVTELSYATKQVSGPAVAAASYQLPVCLTGGNGAPCNVGLAGTPGATSFSTLVYEPYQNGAVTAGNWQTWDVDAGLFWATRTVVCSNGTITGSAGGPASYTLAQIKAACPTASVIGFGVNIGTFNPSYNVQTDLFDFNGVTYNFEPYVVVSDKDACKNDGWKTAVDANGNGFKNQGACVSYVVSKSQH